MTVDVIIEAGDWPASAAIWAQEAFDALQNELSETLAEVAVLLTNDAHIKKLNAQFRDKDKATNVLSWPASHYKRDLGQMPTPVDPDDEFLGDLALGFETVAHEAQAIGLEAHFKHLVIHGVLHLRGFDHIEDKDAEKMEGIEISALARLNIASPYNEEETL